MCKTTLVDMKNKIVSCLVAAVALLSGSHANQLLADGLSRDGLSREQWQLSRPACASLTDRWGESIVLRGTLRPGAQKGVVSFESDPEQKEELREWTRERLGQMVTVELILEDGRTDEVTVPLTAALPGNFRLSGISLTEDSAAAFASRSEEIAALRTKAEKGDVESQLQLAHCFRVGLLVSPSLEEAVTWWHKAAESGSCEAMYNLGCAYAYGEGVPADAAEAAAWWRRAAEKGDALSQAALGNCYLYGQGVPPSDAEAVIWWRRAAEQGFPEAQFNLAYCYEKGTGVEQSYEDAVAWYSKAAEQGNVMAQYNLGVCYEQGKGVEKDPEKAVRLYRKAAALGFCPAQEALREMEPGKQAPAATNRH